LENPHSLPTICRLNLMRKCMLDPKFCTAELAAPANLKQITFMLL
jgi:hypothetical protein